MNAQDEMETGKVSEVVISCKQNIEAIAGDLNNGTITEDTLQVAGKLETNYDFLEKYCNRYGNEARNAIKRGLSEIDELAKELFGSEIYKKVSSPLSLDSKIFPRFSASS